MKEMELLRDVGDDFERALFAAAEREPVPLSSKQDVARRLGLALPELSGSGAAGTHAASATAPEHAAELTGSRTLAGPVVARPVVRGIWGKLTFLAAIVGLGWGWGGSLLGPGHTADGTAATLGAVVTAPSRPTLASESPPPEAKGEMPQSAVAESIRHEASDVAVTTVALEERARRSSHSRRDEHTSVSRARRTSSPNRSTTIRATAAPGSDADDSGLLREVRSLDAVRAALRAHEGTRALERLDAYASEFPQGELAIESQVLRVAALVQTEQRTAARALALRTLGIPGSARYRTELERSLQALERPTAAE